MKFILLINIWSIFGFADSFIEVPLLNIITLLIISFYITANIFTFMAYKEYKACAEPAEDYEANQELGAFGGGAAGGYQPPNNFQPQVNNVRESGNNNFSAFHGQGVRLGGS